MIYRNSVGEAGGKKDDVLPLQRAMGVRVDVADFGGRKKFESTYRPRGTKAEQEKTNGVAPPKNSDLWRKRLRTVARRDRRRTWMNVRTQVQRPG